MKLHYMAFRRIIIGIINWGRFAPTLIQVRERLLFEDMDRAGWFSAAGISGLEANGERGQACWTTLNPKP